MDAPRAAGLVGERFDGYAVVRDPSVSTEIHDIVRQVNSERQKIYEQRAATEGASVNQVGRIYAQEIIRSAPAGIYILQENGNWVQK